MTPEAMIDKAAQSADDDSRSIYAVRSATDEVGSP